MCVLGQTHFFTLFRVISALIEQLMPFQRALLFSYLPFHMFQRSPHAFNFPYFPIWQNMFIWILCSKLQLLIFRRPNEYTCYLYPNFDTIHYTWLKSRPTQVETCKDMVLTRTCLMLTRQGGRKNHSQNFKATTQNQHFTSCRTLAWSVNVASGCVIMIYKTCRPCQSKHKHI